MYNKVKNIISSNHNVILLGSTASATSVNTTAHDTILNGGTHESLVKLSVKTVWLYVLTYIGIGLDYYIYANLLRIYIHRTMCYYNFYLEAKKI